MKYLIVLASASSSLVPVRDCMYFLDGRAIVAIWGWREAEISARRSKGENEVEVEDDDCCDWVLEGLGGR